MKKQLFACALALALASGAAAAPPAPQPPAGAYKVDPAHANLTFRVSHLGFSRYTAKFNRFDAALKFDPANPAAMSVEATIDPKSLELNAPPAGFTDEILGPQWLDAAKYPQITFRSTKVEVTGANTARVTGDFTLHGVTKPVVLEVSYNGGWPPNQFDQGGARAGFSAHGTFKRSDFGVKLGLPPPGTSFGVGDEIDVAIEAEFSDGHPLPKK